MNPLSPKNQSGPMPVPFGHWLRLVVPALILAVVVAMVSTPYMGCGTFTYCLLIVGLMMRKHRRYHVPLMGVGIVGDLIIVLSLEFGRGAVQTALGPDVNVWQHVHILVSSAAGVLYIPVLILGYKLWQQTGHRDTLRPWHIRLALTAFALRTLGYLSMFSFLGFNS